MKAESLVGVAVLNYIVSSIYSYIAYISIELFLVQSLAPVLKQLRKMTSPLKSAF